MLDLFILCTLSLHLGQENLYLLHIELKIVLLYGNEMRSD